MSIQKGKLFSQTLAIIVMTCCVPALAVEKNSSATTKVTESAEQTEDTKPTSSSDKNFLGTIEVQTNVNQQDKKAEDDVYLKNVSNVYVGKEYLERHKVNTAADVLKGLNGVYSMNSHTASSSITPNVRGITGKGRVPVTIDGTEQTIDTWMMHYAVSDRNYIDPAFFRSITVDKSADISSGYKTGVGGAIAIRTLEPEDIIHDGKSWGIQFKSDFSNNSVKPVDNLNKYLGWHDYRTLPLGATADGPGGELDPYSESFAPIGLRLDSEEGWRSRTKANKYNLAEDQSYMLTGAFKNDVASALVAYSYRNKGNYFVGKQGADGYTDNPIYSYSDDCEGIDYQCRRSETFIPNMTKLYPAGSEVFNTNSENKSLLVKNNWFLPNNQKIGLSYMQNDLLFGEVNPFYNGFYLDYIEINPELGVVSAQPRQFLNSKVKTQTYKFAYSWNPEEYSFINLKANAWRVKSNVSRHQSGAEGLSAKTADQDYDAWYWCNVRKQDPLSDDNLTCEDLRNEGDFDENTTREEMLARTEAEAANGDYQVLSGAWQATKSVRDGFDIGNKFQLTKKLNLLVSADFQKENLDEHKMLVNSQDLFNILGHVTGMALAVGPRKANRQEWGVNVVTNWQATDKLNVQAGFRYQNFSGYDQGLAEKRQQRDPFYAVGAGSDSYVSHLKVPYYQLVNSQTLQDYQEVIQKNKIAKDAEINNPSIYADKWQEYKDSKKSFREKHGFYHDDTVLLSPANDTNASAPLETQAVYAPKSFLIPWKNGKLDLDNAEHPYYGMFDEVVENPQGLSGTYYKYLTIMAQSNGSGDRNYNANKKHVWRGYSTGSDMQVRQDLTEDEQWALPRKQKLSDWSPMLALSYELTDNSLIFSRYAKLSRFPSLYELTNSVPPIHPWDFIAPGFDFKPERSTNFEIGYSFDFSSYLDQLRAADIRVSYYHNKIKNVIDTNEQKRIIQYDSKTTSGIEFQSRIDTGKYYSNLGVTYRLTQNMCDKASVYIHDIYLRRVPECIEGGFGAGRFFQGMPPKYSINLDLGMRLFDERLQLGMRALYHGKVKIKHYNELAELGLERVFYDITGKPYHWRASLVIDSYLNYQANEYTNLNLGITNLTNRYYMDPMSNVAVPGPGRTVNMGITVKF